MANTMVVNKCVTTYQVPRTTYKTTVLTFHASTTPPQLEKQERVFTGPVSVVQKCKLARDTGMSMLDRGHAVWRSRSSYCCQQINVAPENNRTHKTRAVLDSFSSEMFAGKHKEMTLLVLPYLVLIYPISLCFCFFNTDWCAPIFFDRNE